MKRISRSVLARLGLALAVASFVAGCKRDEVHVESNTFWEGSINNRITISGYGDKTYEIHGTLGCVKVVKQRPDSLYLRLRINDRPGEATSAPLGSLFQCK